MIAMFLLVGVMAIMLLVTIWKEWMMGKIHQAQMTWLELYRVQSELLLLTARGKISLEDPRFLLLNELLNLTIESTRIFSYSPISPWSLRAFVRNAERSELAHGILCLLDISMGDIPEMRAIAQWYLGTLAKTLGKNIILLGTYRNTLHLTHSHRHWVERNLPWLDEAMDIEQLCEEGAKRFTSPPGSSYYH